MVPAIFLSPDYDDLALSSGGTVALLADAIEETMVVSVFGGEVTTTCFATSRAGFNLCV
jgi:hypothetical protein